MYTLRVAGQLACAAHRHATVRSTLCQLTADYLAPLGFRVEVAPTGGAGHAVILAVMLPDVDGFEVRRRIRAKSKVPVLMLAGRGGQLGNR